MTKWRKMADEIRKWLLDHEMWSDVTIFFDGVAYSTSDGKGNYYYNDPEHLIELHDRDPRDYFSYVNPDHILSMSFEGPLYEMLNYYDAYPDDWRDEFDGIFRKYGVYYELGNAWNLTVYRI